MRSPAEMGTIQIDITNACTLQCSNCTRFCGNHKSNFFMDYETFTKAVNSLDGYNGVIGIIGGEPTIHPEFRRFVGYLQKKFGKRQGVNRLIYPQKNFIREIRRRECESHVLRETEDGRRYMKTRGLGLWSNMNASYRKHYEIIQDTFHVQYLNDHLNPSYHQPGLFARKDLEISDKEWILIRDKCWIQNEWSATITPKGAFFCEIAGALDMLFNGDGGWKIEPGWWKRRPEEFGEQLKWCELCGFALSTFVRNAEEETDDVSPSLYEKLKYVGSPKMKTGRINVVKIEKGVIDENSKAEVKSFDSYDRYLEHYEDRFCEANSVLFGVEYEKIIYDGKHKLGEKLNDFVKSRKDWVLLITDNNTDYQELLNLIGKYVFNPGTLHLGKGYAFFSILAQSVRKIGIDGLGSVARLKDIIDLWDPDKIVSISNIDEKLRLHYKSIQPNVRYVVWGTGIFGEFLSDVIISSEAELFKVVDIDEKKVGKEFYGKVIENPICLQSHINDFDVLLISPIRSFIQAKKMALDLGIPESKIRLPYEV